MRRVATLVAMLVASTPARADSPDALVAEGQDLAKRGQIGDAIAKFKQADALEPRAIHSCLIGLAYLRGGLFGDAELMFARCRSRSTQPLPPWVAIEEAALAKRLETAQLGTVALTLDPAIVELAVPALLGGTPFPARRTLRLPPGPHRIVGRTADGRELVGELTVTIGMPNEISLTTVSPSPSPKLSALRVGPAIHEEPPPPRSEPSSAPTILIASGGAVLVAGGLVHLLGVRPARASLADAATDDVYDARYDSFALRRNLTIGMYAVGGVALITGLVLSRRSPESPRVSAQLTDGGAAFAVEWSR